MDILESKLLNVYNQYGIDMFLQVAHEMINIKENNNFDKKKKVNGGVCEVVLRIMTEDYIRKRKIKGFTVRSLVLKKPYNESNFRTELDFCLFTEQVVLCGECKSFRGNKVITDKCLLTAANRIQADIYQQQSLHIDILKQHLNLLNNESSNPLRAFCFILARGSLKDVREDKYKKILPVLTVNDLYDYYDSIFNNCLKQSYDYDKLKKFFSVISNSKLLHEQHKEYLGY